MPNGPRCRPVAVEPAWRFGARSRTERRCLARYIEKEHPVTAAFPGDAPDRTCPGESGVASALDLSEFRCRIQPGRQILLYGAVRIVRSIGGWLVPVCVPGARRREILVSAGPGPGQDRCRTFDVPFAPS